MFPVPQPDFPQIPVLPIEKLRNSPAAVLTTNPNDEETLALVARHLADKLVLPEYWSQQFPQCGVLISSSISGGDLSRRFQQASEAYPHRCWMLLEPLCMEFPLPCPTGVGHAISQPPDRPGIYSPSLCCHYTHYLQNGHGVFALWDTDETRSRKLHLAREWGFLGFASSFDTAPPVW